MVFLNVSAHVSLRGGEKSAGELSSVSILLIFQKRLISESLGKRKFSRVSVCVYVYVCVCCKGVLL